MRTKLITLFGLLFSLSLTAQETADSAAPQPPKNLLEAFRKGRAEGQFRTFFMATDNTRDLSDYEAWAVGGALQYRTAPFHGFRFGLSGMFMYNLASTDLTRRDSATDAVNRYEIGLFDVTDPANRHHLNRLEEFWLRYERKKWFITLGRQNLQTPFINPQDGRMAPSVESGAWLQTKELKNTVLQGGWLWAVSPRSTVKWYGVGESMGLYPTGRNPDGTASGYADHLETRGIGLLGITHRIGARTSVQFWEQYVQNIFNTAFAQIDYAHPLPRNHKLLLGLQYTHQNALSAGGNAEPAFAYFPKGSRSDIISTQLGWAHGRWQALTAYTRITAAGRFLAPREWGREPFYTFMPRERLEGSGDARAFTARVSWRSAAPKWRFELAYGRFQMPDIKNTALNKYAFPAFDQLNFDARYTFGGALKGLRAQALVVWKKRVGEVYGNDKYVINKVDMVNYNLVLNYVF